MIYQTRAAIDQPSMTARRTLRWTVALVVCATLVGSSGCSAFGLGNTKLVQELQSENDRLLAEFRAERNRREQTEKTLQIVENRLAESEKLLARQYSPSTNRLSQLPALGTGNSVGPQSSSNRTPFSSDWSGADSYDPADLDSGLRWQRRFSQ